MTSMPEHDARLPVTLLTGFLGAGKTTLLNHLVRQQAMQGCAVLINEFGDVGIDHLLVDKLDEDTVLLDSGCLCCTMRGDLSRSLRELFMRAIRREISGLRRVVIETSGLADPAPVIFTLMHDFFLAERFRLDGVVAVVDATHGESYLVRRPEAVKQIALADRLVLSKVDLADSDQQTEVERRIRDINPGASLLRAVRGEIAAEELIGCGHYAPVGTAFDMQRWLAFEPSRAGAHDTMHGRGSDPNRHGETTRAYSFRYDTPIAWADFSTALDMLQHTVGGALLRFKGIVNVRGESLPRVVQGVHHARYPELVLPQWPDEDRSTRLVFIVDGLPRAVIEQAFASFCGLPPRGNEPRE